MGLSQNATTQPKSVGFLVDCPFLEGPFAMVEPSHAATSWTDVKGRL